ncbi:MAG: PEP/pyruvate-binding domain-containing protein [Candidatus Nanopelagicales bacterium]
MPQLYRRQERIPSDLGTAVNVQAMVFGNSGEHSGTGVAFTRDPATGDPRRLRRLPGRARRARTSCQASATRSR